MAEVTLSKETRKLFDARAFGARAREARAHLDVERAREGKGRPTVLELSAQMAKVIGEPVSDRDVGKWLRGEGMPGTLLRLWGFASVLGADAGWLAFNGQTAALPPSSRPPIEDDGDDEPLPRPQSPARRRA